MLTLGQQISLDNLAKNIVARVKEAINNKPIDRVSVRFKDGQVTKKNFKAPSKASGKSANSVAYEITDKGVEIKANESVFTLIYGRKPTSAAGNGSLKDNIKQWILDKGIQSDISNDSLAFLIARKIHSYGSSIYLNTFGANSGLLSDVLNQSDISKFNEQFSIQLNKELSDVLNGN